MKVVLLAGGLGSRLSEETTTRPKPMVEIGGRPILWHIMNIYSAYGVNDFVVATGYKSEVIKEYFANFHLHQADLSVELRTGKLDYHNRRGPEWRVTMVDTGAETQTGGRLKRLRDWLKDETFMMTYGDGLANVDISSLLKFHKAHNKIATVSAVRPPARFGSFEFSGDQITKFTEKPQVGEGWINGGYMVLNPGVFDYLTDDKTIFEREPMERLARDGQLMAYRHEGFWQPMDTLREKQLLEELWQSGKAAWKVWTD